MKPLVRSFIDRVALLFTAIIVIALITLIFVLLDPLRIPDPVLRYVLDFCLSGIAALLGFRINRWMEKLIK